MCALSFVLQPVTLICITTPVGLGVSVVNRHKLMLLQKVLV